MSSHSHHTHAKKSKGHKSRSSSSSDKVPEPTSHPQIYYGAYGQPQQVQAYQQPYGHGYGQQQTYGQKSYQAPAPQVDQSFLWGVFRRVDRDGNGVIDCIELQGALSNGTWNPFNIETVRLMISMFDEKDHGTINFNEFCGLWHYVTDWQNMFIRFDADQSGYIDKEELKNCLSSFGYRLSDRFYDLMIIRFDRSHQGRLYFDDYIQLCVMLQTLTSAFREKDTERKGHIRLTYEEFLIMVFNTRI